MSWEESFQELLKKCRDKLLEGEENHSNIYVYLPVDALVSVAHMKILRIRHLVKKPQAEKLEDEIIDTINYMVLVYDRMKSK